MQTKLLYFAGLREALQCEGEQADLPGGITGQGLLDWLAGKHPAEAPLIYTCSLAQDEEFLGLEEEIRQGAQVALLPPVSGG